MNPIRSALLTAKRPRQFAGGGKAGVIERAAAPAPAPAPEPAPAQATDVTPQPANVPLPPQKPAYLQSFDYSKYDNPLEARYNFLSKALNPTIAAAALGNFGIESYNNPNQFQTRTGAPEGEPLYDKNNMPLGYGSAQWGGTRLTNPANDPNKMGLFDFAKEYGFDPNSTEGQDRFMVYELTQNPEYAGAYKNMQAAGNDLNKVTSIFGSDYESPANLGKTLGDRQVTAQMFHDYFNNRGALDAADQAEVSRTIMGMMSDPMFQSYAANKNNATDFAAAEDAGPMFTQQAGLNLQDQQDAINAAQQAAVQQSQNFDTGIVQNAATDFNYLNPLQGTGIGDFTNMYTGINYNDPVVNTPSITDYSYNAFDNSAPWSFAVGGAAPYVPPRKDSWIDRTNKDLQEEVLSPEKEDEASEYYQKWQREGSPKQRRMFAHGGDPVEHALRLARGGYADGGDPPEENAQPNESLLMREAVTPRSLAQSWTPPEEAIAARSPIAADFMAQYPQKMGEAAVNTFKYPGQLLYGEKELNPEEAVDWANTAAGIAMTGGIGGVGAKTGEAVLGSGPVRQALEIAKQPRELSPLGFYSHGADTAANLQQAKGTPQQFKSMLEKAGVKPVEMEGFDEAFANRPSVTREEIAQHFNEKMPQVEETVLGGNKTVEQRKAELEAMGDNRSLREENELSDIYNGDWVAGDYPHDKTATKFGQYTLPGGENYREVLLRLPVQGNEAEALNKIAQDMYGKNYTDLMGDTSDLAKMRLAIKREYKNQYGESGLKAENAAMFRSSHWDDPNVLAHLRMSDRTGPNGEKILHVEEIQSDWGQEGKKEGFKQAMTPEQAQERTDLAAKIRQGNPSNADLLRLEELDRLAQKEQLGLPTAPYVTNTQAWTDLALKRALRESAEGGYDKLVWTPGAEQAKRYKLSNHVNSIDYMREGNDTYRLGITNKQGEGIDLPKDTFTAKELEDYLGKEVAQKIIADEGKAYRGRNHKTLEGVDLEVGGSGMKGYYDKIVPNQLSKLVKKLDPEAKISRETIPVARQSSKEFVPSGPKMENAPQSYEMPSLTITPKMREAIMKGQTAYKHGGSIPFGPEAAQSAVKIAKQQAGRR